MIKDNVSVFPRVVRIEPSSLCNLRCRHCPTGTVEIQRGLMDCNTFSNVLTSIRENADYVKVVVMYHGGEPLINKNFIDMIKELKKLGIPFIKTVSNGMLLTGDICNELCECGLNQIEFSIDGTNPEENNFIRRNADYETVINNIKTLLSVKKNKKSALQVIISTTQFVREGQSIEDSQSLTPDIPEFLKKEFADELEAKSISFKVCYAMKWPKLPVDKDVFNEMPVTRNPKNYCDHISNTLTVRANGDVVPCCYDLTSEIVLGNINQNNLKDIWHSDLYKKMREDIENLNFPELCSGCFVVSSSTLLSMNKH